MLKHIFYKKYANTPLPKRAIGKIIRVGNAIKTLDKLYTEIHNYDEIIRKAEARQKELLEQADYLTN